MIDLYQVAVSGIRLDGRRNLGRWDSILEVSQVSMALLNSLMCHAILIQQNTLHTYPHLPVCNARYRRKKAQYNSLHTTHTISQLHNSRGLPDTLLHSKRHRIVQYKIACLSSYWYYLKNGQRTFDISISLLPSCRVGF